MEHAIKAVENVVASAISEVKTGTVLPPTSNISIHKLYSVADIAKIIGMSISYVHQQIAKHKPEVVGREGHHHLYRYDFLETLMNNKATKRDRVDIREEHKENHQTILQRLHMLEQQVKVLQEQFKMVNAKQVVVSRILGE
jgi:hypothetical protein